MELGCCCYALQRELGIRECEASKKRKVDGPDLQRFLLVKLQGAFLCPLRLSFDTRLIPLVDWVDVAVKLDDERNHFGRKEGGIDKMSHLLEGMHCGIIESSSWR